MDVKEYITSGILEAYVLGGLSDKERQEVECMSSIYEEIGAELSGLQAGFEAVAKQHAIEPPAALKVSIMEAIKNTPQDHLDTEETTSEAPIVPMNTNTSKSQVWRVAAVVFVLLSTGLGYMYSNNLSELDKKSERISALDETLDAQKSMIEANQSQLDQVAALNSLLSDKETQQVVMPGTDLVPDASTRVFYNPSVKQVALQVDYLPEAPADKQYQLWAIVDGKPTDMGVLESSDLGKTLVVDYDSGAPDAFAITLEKAGGSAQPDLSNLYVIGNA